MIRLNEDALKCDFAETYQIYDYRSLPVQLAATFAAGLRENSRIKMLASGQSVPMETLLLATIADRIAMFAYGFSDAAKHGKDKPKSIVEAINGDQHAKTKGVTRFASVTDFEAALKRIKRSIECQEAQH